MFSATDFNKLQQIMDESSEKKELLTKLLESHQLTLSTLSHEIRNPLTLVYSTLQLIESQHPEVSSFQYWSDLRRDVEYMKLLLEQLSAYNNGNRLHRTSFDANTFFKSLALSFAVSLVDTDIQFISEISPNLPAIYGDYLKIREMLLNLLINARDAVQSPKDVTKESPAIHFSVSQEKNLLKIIIQDNGCGIPSDKLPHIFEPFTTYKKNGTGLGLAITEKIINAHAGTIHVSSNLGSGTMFTLTLPVQKNA